MAANAVISPAETTESAAELPPGAGWRLEQPVASGRFCQVFRGSPEGTAAGSTGRYALKILRPKWHDDADAIGLLRREASVGRAVRHPHLVPVLRADVSQPPYMLVLPWLAGQTLDRPLAAGWRPAVPMALWLARQTAQALGALHEIGWMHGDVKPAHVLMAASGHATLIDLGFARPQREQAALARPSVAGTLAYMAPELLAAGPPADIRSDLYSLGAMLQELLTGQPAAEAQRANADIPREVAHLLRELLANEPLRRPQTPGELVAVLCKLETQFLDQREWLRVSEVDDRPIAPH